MRRLSCAHGNYNYGIDPSSRGPRLLSVSSVTGAPSFLPRKQMIRCHRRPCGGSKLATFVNDMSPFFQNRSCSFLSLLSPFYCEWLFANLNYRKFSQPNRCAPFVSPHWNSCESKDPSLTPLPVSHWPLASGFRRWPVHCDPLCVWLLLWGPNCSPKKTLVRSWCSLLPHSRLPGNLFSALRHCKRCTHSTSGPTRLSVLPSLSPLRFIFSIPALIFPQRCPDAPRPTSPLRGAFPRQFLGRSGFERGSVKADP